MNKPKVTYLATGQYDVICSERFFEIERDQHGDWGLYEIKDNKPLYVREYWNHFATKRDAINAIKTGCAC